MRKTKKDIIKSIRVSPELYQILEKKIKRGEARDFSDLVHRALYRYVVDRSFRG